MATAYYYQPEKNPNGAALPGVPLRDLTDDEVAQYPAYIKRSLEASPMYRKTNPEYDKPRATVKKAPAKSKTKRNASTEPVAAPLVDEPAAAPPVEEPSAPVEEG